MARVLVTGATGFIGSHLVEALVARGDRVRCLVRVPERARSLAARGAELVAGDLADAAAIQAALADVETVFHLAGLTRALSRDDWFRINEGGTERLMAACADRSRAPTVVLMSSVAAAGPARRGQLRIEADPPAPVSVYGESKLAGERAATQYAAQVPLTILRPGVVFGPRDTALIKVCQAIRAVRFHVAPGFAPPPLSWIYVTDLVDLALRAADRGGRVAGTGNGQPGQGIYFGACPEYPTWLDMGRLMRPLLRRPFALLIPIPGPIAWAVACANEGLPNLSGQAKWLSRDKIREALVSSWACSGEAARRELDFSTPRPLVDRFRETIEWYRAEKWLRS